MPDDHDDESKGPPPRPAGPGIIVVSGGLGCIMPVVLGVAYGMLFLENWNIWPAFIIVGSLLGLIAGVVIGMVIHTFRK